MPASPDTPRPDPRSDPRSDPRYDRLRRTASLGDGAHELWCTRTVLVVGAGALGSVLAPEITRSGASLVLCDPELGALENLGTQRVEVGRPKAEAVADLCNAQRPGSARALVADVLDLGVGTLRGLDALVDATDDPRLARPLTELSNGLRIPLVRVAVDGSGEREFGRVLVSHGGGGHACQLCSWSTADLFRGAERTPCPGRSLDGARPSTLAGGALALAVCGLGLLQLQRLLGGRQREAAVDHELLLDLDHAQLHALQLDRSRDCLSGHDAWTLWDCARTVHEMSVGELFERAAGEMGVPSGDDSLTLQAWGQPLCLLAQCEACDRHVPSVGTVRAAGPRCDTCGQTMVRRRDHRWPRFSRRQAQRVGILDRSLASLGLHPDGALVIAARPGRPPLHLALAAADSTALPTAFPTGPAPSHHVGVAP